MAILMRPSPAGELAKLLGQAAGMGSRIYRQEKDVGAIGDLYQQELGYSPESARALARNPQQAHAYFQVEAAKKKRMTEEQEKDQKKKQASNILNEIKIANAESKESGRISKFLGNAAPSIFKGNNAQKQRIKGYIDILKKNQAVKDLDIALPNEEDDPEVIDAFIDEALNKLKGTGADQEDVQEATAQARTQPEEQPTEQPDEQMAADNQEAQVNQAMASQLQQPPMQPPLPPQGQPTTLEQLPTQLANVGREAAAGLYSGATLPVRALEGIRSMVAPQGPITPEQQAAIERRVGLQQQAFGRPSEELPQAIQRELQKEEIIRQPLALPTREDAYKYLGGTDEKNLFAKSLNEMVGDITEQLPLAAVTGAFGGIAKTVQALKGIGITQGAGNFAKWLSKEAGESDEFANNAKLGFSLLTAYGLAPSLKETARNTYTAAENGIPAGMRISKANQGAIQDAASSLNNILSKPSSGYIGNSSPLQYFYRSQYPEYKDAFNAIKEIQTSGSNLSKSARVGLQTFYKRLINDVKSNKEVPTAVTTLFDKAAAMWKNLKNSEDAVSFIESLPVVGRALKNKDLAGVLGLGLIGTYSQKGALLGAGAFGIKKGMDIAKGLYLFSTSPGMRDYYLKMMNAALQYDGAQATKYLFGLNRMIENKTKKK